MIRRLLVWWHGSWRERKVRCYLCGAVHDRLRINGIYGAPPAYITRSCGHSMLQSLSVRLPYGGHR